MSTKFRRIGTVVAASALVLAGVAVAAPAHAEEIPGQIHLYAQASGAPLTRGAEITSGSTTQNPMYYSISVDATCPVGFKAANAIAIFQGGVFRGAAATPLTPTEGTVYGQWGSSAQNIAISDVDNSGTVNPYASNKALSAIAGLTDGAFELRYYCRADEILWDHATDKYYALDLQKTGSTWSVYSAPVAEATTVSLTANAVGTSVTLEGTVKNASNATATAAAGSIEFFELPNTTTPVATVAVASGVASTTLAGVANGLHNYQAKFVSSNTATFNSSALSGSATAIVGSNTQQSTVTVTIPSNGRRARALRCSRLGVPRHRGDQRGARTGTFDASGTLSGVTVTDTRSAGLPGLEPHRPDGRTSVTAPTPCWASTSAGRPAR